MYTQEEQDIITGIAVATGVLSMIGSLFIVVCYLVFKDLRSFAFTLVFWMSLCDFFASIAKVMGDGANSGPLACHFQSIMMSFAELASVLWAGSIAFTLHKAYLQGVPAFSGSQIIVMAPRYHAVIWSVVLLLVLLPLSTNSYGDAGGWCWIKEATTADKVWRYVQYYIILWAAWCYCIFVYVKVYNKMHREMGQDEKSKEQRAVVLRIMFYPVILVVMWFPATLNRLVELFSGQVYGLTVLHVLFAGLYGFANALTYGATPSVKTRLKICLCGRRNQDQHAMTEMDEMPQPDTSEDLNGAAV